MRTRHEQVQAYRFTTRRIVSALLVGEPETTELPMRRLAMSLFGSFLIGTIVLAGVGVYGFINPSGGRAPEGGIAIMRETGARYAVYEGTLHPVLNWTSALLFAGSATPAVKTMSRRSLRRYPVGYPIGIPAAPDPPPDARSLVGLPWSVCGVRVDNRQPGTQMAIGWTPAGGTALSTATLLVTTGDAPSSPRFLIWNNRRHLIANLTAQTALGLAAAPPLRTSQQVLNAVPAGVDLTVPRIPRAGEPSAVQVGGRAGEIGRVYRSGEQYYVLLANGLSPVAPVMALLLMAQDNTSTQISAGEAARASTTTRIEPAGFPMETLPPPRLNGAEAAMVCATHHRQDGARFAVEVQLYDRADPRLPAATDLPARPGADGVRPADRVVVDAGRGALVRVQPAPGVTAATTVYLVTDQGYKYPLSENGVLDALGYAGVEPVRVPTDLLALVPTGPTLDRGAALRPAPAPVGPSTPAAPGSPSRRPSAPPPSSAPPSSTPPSSAPPSASASGSPSASGA